MPIPAHLTNYMPKRLERGFEGYALSHFVLYTDPGFPPELLLDPDFWVHVVPKFKAAREDRPPSHLVLVIATDGSFEAELRVMAIDRRGLWAEMRLLRDWPLGIVAECAANPLLPVIQKRPGPDADGYLIEESGPQRWRIVLGGAVVEHGLADEAAAVAMLASIKAAKPAAKTKAAA